MTREKEINKAVNTYMNGLFEDGIEIPIEDFENIEEGFIAGATWADNNSKSQWISVDDDLPCKHSQLLENINYTQSVLVVLSWNDDPTKKHIETAHMCNKIGSFDVNWYWENRAHYHVTHWMPLPELPK